MEIILFYKPDPYPNNHNWNFENEKSFSIPYTKYNIFVTSKNKNKKQKYS